VLDLGGGFAAPYARRGTPRPFADLRARLERLLDATDGERPALWFESGRFLVGRAGSLVCTVLDVKTMRGERSVIVDSGIHHLGGMSGLRRVPPLAPELIARSEAEAFPARVVGELCTSLDCWAPRAQLPFVQPGDLLLIPNVGAYGLSASLLGFLSHETPKEIVVSGDDVVSATRLSIGRNDVEGCS
jgi:diaminopimelate decarboxylase